ncbi:hypothetical protein N2152v2_008689 [Parachlorella kessleri]
MSDASFFANLDDPMATPLHWAALRGNLGEVQALLNADPGACKAVDSHGWTALHWAVGAGQADCAAWLVRAGASLEARGSESHTPWVSKLRPPAAGRAADLALGPFNRQDSKATKGATPLHIAAAMGHVECICQLLQLQACPEAANSLGFTALRLAAACNHLQALRALVRGGADTTVGDGTRLSPCHVAAACGSLECLQELIRLGLRSGILALAIDGRTPLHCATEAGAVDSVRELLAAGANVEGKPVKGTRPLHVAAMFGHTEVARVLIMAGADIEARGIVGTPLHFAAVEGHIETALALVAAGADVEAASPSDGLGSRTPIQQAAACGKVDVVTALAAAGADINAQNENGWNCLHHFLAWVAQSKAEDAVPRLQQLLDAGAVMATCGCRMTGPLTFRDGTPGLETLNYWLSGLTPDDWAAQWPAKLNSTMVDIGVALLQSAGAEAGMESIEDAFSFVKHAMAAGSTPLVLAALGLLPEDSLDDAIIVLASLIFKVAMKALPNPGWGGWGERHRQVVHHYCDMAEALLAAGCAPLQTTTGWEALESLDLPGELVQMVASGQRWSPDEAHHAFPPAFRAATRALLLANHRGLATPAAPGSEDTAEPGQKGVGTSLDTGERVRLPPGVVLLILDKAAHPPAAWVPQLQPGSHAPRPRVRLSTWKLGLAVAALAATTAGLAVVYMRGR